MKQSFSKYLLAGSLLVAGAAGAQDSNVQQDAQAKKQEAQIKKAEADLRRKEQKAIKGDVQQIIITRNSNDNETTVVAIKGDKVTINGKDVKELKDSNIDVDINRLKDVDALVTRPGAARAPMAMAMPRVWNFQNEDGDGPDFFTEDSTRAMLGVMTSEDEKGARINDVSKESAAEKAGLKKDDIITRINDAKIEDAGDVTEQVRKHKPGDKVTVTVLRDGKEQKIVAELTKWKGLKVNAQNFRVMMPSRVTPFEQNERIDLNDFNFEMNGFGRPRLGLSVQDSEDGKGVVVQDVDEESNAAKAGIKEGDVITRFNDTEINDVTVLRREMNANKDKISAKISLLRNGKAQTVDVKMPRKLKTADL